MYPHFLLASRCYQHSLVPLELLEPAPALTNYTGMMPGPLGWLPSISPNFPAPSQTFCAGRRCFQTIEFTAQGSTVSSITVPRITPTTWYSAPHTHSPTVHFFPMFGHPTDCCRLGLYVLSILLYDSMHTYYVLLFDTHAPLFYLNNPLSTLHFPMWACSASYTLPDMCISPHSVGNHPHSTSWWCQIWMYLCG